MRFPCYQIEWDENGRFKAKHDTPDIGRSLIMSPFNAFFTWQTTTITGILEQREDYICFDTKNSRYELFKIKEIHFSITSNENRDNDFYTSKEESRIDGPWRDTDEKLYIPRQVREITTLYPWQQYIVDNYDVWDTRTINIIIDARGNTGKSTLVSYMRAWKLAFKIPYCNDFRDILRMVCDVPIKRCYLIDMPRAIKKDKLFQLFSAIEEIKNGYAYDDRYQFKEKVFDCPNIWIFTNILPTWELLSNDRWRVWEVDAAMNLTPHGVKNGD